MFPNRFFVIAFSSHFDPESSVNLDTDDKTLSIRFPDYKRNYRNMGELCRNLKGKFDGNSANVKFELRIVLYNVRKKSHSLILNRVARQKTHSFCLQLRLPL